MIYADAAQLVLDDLGKTWTNGTLAVFPAGFEDDGAFAVRFGRSEWVKDGDVMHMPISGAVALVGKATQQVSLISYTANPERIDAMTPTATA